MIKKPLASIPEPPRNTDPALRNMLMAIKEAVEVRLGRRGDPLEEGVTKRDLIESGIAKLGSPARASLEPVVVVDEGTRIVPPAPLGFTAEPAFGGIQLSWEDPFAAYGVHGYTEIWRAESNNPLERVLLNSSRGSAYFDRLPDTEITEYWYWIRFVSIHNRMGAFSLPFNVQRLEDIGYLIEQLSGQIDQSMLAEEFNQSVSLLQNSWSIKLDPSGNYASGFITYNDGLSSSFAVLADEFSVGSPAVGKVKPFIISGGTVYIDTAMIRDASIQQGKLGPITFGKITDAAGNPVTTLSGKLRADAIDVENLRVTDANIAGVIKSNTVASNGQPRWLLDKNGGMTLNGSGAGGRMEIRDSVIKVFDARGRLRVQIGDMNA